MSASVANSRVKLMLGEFGENLLIAFVVDDLSFRKIAQRFGRDSRELAGATEMTLKFLACYYEMLDGKVVGNGSRMRVAFS